MKSPHTGFELRLRLQNGLYQREKLRPEGRQIDTPCRARKELTSEFFFQERNAVGQGRLRNVALFSRLAEGTLLCGGEWYEDFPRRMRLAPIDFAMSYVTRSGRVDVERLRRISPRFVERYACERPLAKA
jgi:hypothetical protein